MKTIRYQIKYAIGLRLPMLLWKGIKSFRYLVFYELTKRTTNRQQTKI